MGIATVPQWCYADLAATPQVCSYVMPGSPTQQVTMAIPTQMLPHDGDLATTIKQQLGIQAWEDADFGWIAEELLQSPLPPKWTTHTDEDSGLVYYVDGDLQTSSWEHPWLPYCRCALELGRSYMLHPREGYFEEHKGLLWHQHKQQLDSWHGPFSDVEGHQYFVNSKDGVSSWQDPRVDTQHVFEFQSRVLSKLDEVLPSQEPDTPGFGPDIGISWATQGSEEVLALQSPKLNCMLRAPPTPQRRASELLQGRAQQTAKQEQRSMLEHMTSAAEKLRSLQQDDEEAQRLAFSRKLAERRRRGRSACAVVASKPLPAQQVELTAGMPHPPPPVCPTTPVGQPLPLMKDMYFAN